MNVLTKRFGEMFVSHLSALLVENPFLVAEILQEAEKKETEKTRCA
jgi:hypothetical protein